ncbi:MAG TPA: protein kinase [Vicinamibacterales bacterium]
MLTEPTIRDLVDSVADGTDGVDWDGIEANLASPQDRELVRQLRVLASISHVHRTQGRMVAPETSEGGAARIIGRIEPRTLPVAGERTAEDLLQDGRPRKWGHLQLLELVGEGTFGDVYRAFDTQLHREVALKLLRVGGSTDKQIARVLHEGRVLARMSHPNVVRVLGAESHDGRVGLWMELIRGVTLAKLLRTQGAFSAREAALIGQDVCRAVAAVHAAGLVHRDIKAQNVMREAGGRIVLMDFGAGGAQTRAGRESTRVTGTPLYLAPEVLLGGDATPASDIYSIGVLLYHLVTQEFPVRASTVEELKEAHRAGRVHRLQDVRPDLPDAFVQVVERALAPSPAERIASAGELQQLLGQSVGLPAPLPAPGLWTRIRGTGRTMSRRALAGVAAALVAVALGVMAWTRIGTPSPIVVAVLPLEHAADVPVHLAEDLAERTAETLGQVQGLRVVSREAARRLQRAYTQGERLDSIAEYLLTGRLSASGRGFTARYALVRADGGGIVWERDFTGPTVRVAGAVSSALLKELMPDTQLPHAASDVDEVAGELDARARYALEHGRDRAGTAISLFQQAIATDANYARAHAGLARAYMLRGCREGGTQARLTAEHALQLAPTSAEATTTLADVTFLCAWNWAEAEAGYRAAVAQNPSDEYASIRFAMFLAARGDTGAALEEITRVRQLTGETATVGSATAQLLYYARRFDAALAQIQRVLQVDPELAVGYLAQGRILAAMGRYDEAARSFAQAQVLDPVGLQDYFRAEIAAADAAAGRADRAWQFVQAAERERGTMPAEMVAFVYARLGRHDEAFRWLHRGLDAGSDRLLWLRVDPRADPLRDDPRFQDVLARLEQRRN